MVIIFNKDEHGVLIVPQPHFNEIYKAIHVDKLKRSSGEWKLLCTVYPQLVEHPVTGRLAKSFEG